MLAVAIGAAGLLACEEQEESRGIVIGKIDFDDPTWPLPQIPETATVGVPVEIAVWTGGSGCYEYVETGGGGGARWATVIPYDTFIVGGCSTDREFVEHRTTRIFEEPGTSLQTRGSPIEPGQVETCRGRDALCLSDRPTRLRPRLRHRPRRLGRHPALSALYRGAWPGCLDSLGSSPGCAVHLQPHHRPSSVAGGRRSKRAKRLRADTAARRSME